MNHTLSIDQCAQASCIRQWWGVVRFSWNCGVKEGRDIVVILCLHGKADGRLMPAAGWRRCRLRIAFPDPRIIGICSYSSYCGSLFFETLHVEFSNSSRRRTPHGCAFSLFVNWSVISEVCGSQYKSMEVSDLSVVRFVRPSCGGRPVHYIERRERVDALWSSDA